MLSCHDDGLISLKYLPEGRTKELDIMMSPSYFKPEPQLEFTESLDASANNNETSQGNKLVKKITYRHSTTVSAEKLEFSPVSTLIRVSQKYLTF
jgi:hypothetical protein